MSLEIGNFVEIKNSIHKWYGQIISLRPLKARINRKVIQILRAGFTKVNKKEVPDEFLLEIIGKK